MLASRIAAVACWLLFVVGGSPAGAQSSAPSVPSPAAPSQQTAASTRPPAPVAAMDWANVKRYEQANAALPAPAPGTRRVVFMGDSITQGWAAQRESFFTSNGYVGRGISGQTTSQMLLRFHQDVVALDPAAVVILAGTNDVAENTGPMTDEQVLDNLAAMVEIARAHDIRPVLGSIPPATRFAWRPGIEPRARIRELNLKIRAWAGAHDVSYADFWTAMSVSDGGMKPEYAGDSVHPNAEGYGTMEPIVQAAIGEALRGR